MLVYGRTIILLLYKAQRLLYNTVSKKTASFIIDRDGDAAWIGLINDIL